MARKAAKPARRKRTTGSVRFKKGRAAPWEAAFPNGDGSDRYHSFQSRPAAAAWLDALVAARAAGRDLAGGAQYFKDFIQAWLATRIQKIGPKTLHGYRYHCEFACGEGGLGNRTLESITQSVIDEMVWRLAAGGTKSIAQMCTPLKQAFDYAKKQKYIAANPFDDLEMPDVDHREIIVLNQRQRAQLLDIARVEHDPAVPLCPLWHFYARLGMRKGEGIAQVWANVDWEAQTILIRESVTNVGAENIRGKTKNKKPRIAPLPDDLYQMLVDLRAWQRRRGVFPSIFVDKDGETVTPQHVQYRWAELRTRAGHPDVNLHALRHTALYLMALDGVPENVRMALAGHMSKEMARRYSEHATVEDIRRHMG